MVEFCPRKWKLKVITNEQNGRFVQMIELKIYIAKYPEHPSTRAAWKFLSYPKFAENSLKSEKKIFKMQVLLITFVYDGQGPWCSGYPSYSCLLGKSKITGANTTLAFKFQRNKIFLLRGSNFESCVWRAVSSHLSHNPQEVLFFLAQFSLYVHTIQLMYGLKYGYYK